MSEWPALDRFLRTDPRDVGCTEAMDVLHLYVELVASGQDPALQYPGVVAHLLACQPCSQDHDGLLAAIRADAQVWPPDLPTSDGDD
jgi:hypothetical protein